ncbi:MAG TPA: hypothetical protein VE645_19000 [Pseudonocardiaceae bacterium]|jgi:hypothetical protein|nr:hypothetical protein [Pseudonocardiaceae bacterium]
MTTLPSIQECHEFFDALNAERMDLGLEPLELGELNFDGARPGYPHGCLSALNCYRAVHLAVGTELATTTGHERRIPDAIPRVTDYFDARDPLGQIGSDEVDDDVLARVARLRARFVEAGIVRPA